MNKLNKILMYASKHVEKYKGLDNDIECFPVINKTIIRNDSALFRSDDLVENNMHFEYTSGTTGEPLVCSKSSDDLNRLNISLFHHRFSNCKKLLPPLKAIRFWGRNELSFVYKNTLLLSIPSLNENSLLNYINEIYIYQPNYIFCTPSALLKFTMLLLEENKMDYLINNTNIVYIELSGEIVTEDIYDYLKNAWKGARICNHYGCRETWHIGFGAGDGVFHLCQDNVYIEILDDDNTPVDTGEEGNIVITSLNIYSIPFIRYSIGDKGYLLRNNDSASELKLLNGRSSEMVCVNQKHIPTASFHQVFKRIHKNGFKGILKYSVLSDIDSVIIRLVVSNEFNHSCESIIKEYLNEILPINTTIKIEYSNKIYIDNSGKNKIYLPE